LHFFHTRLTKQTSMGSELAPFALTDHGVKCFINSLNHPAMAPIKRTSILELIS
jgi:hypothetical protein